MHEGNNKGSSELLKIRKIALKMADDCSEMGLKRCVTKYSYLNDLEYQDPRAQALLETIISDLKYANDNESPIAITMLRRGI